MVGRRDGRPVRRAYLGLKVTSAALLGGIARANEPLFA
jgi:hypothetical protein